MPEYHSCEWSSCSKQISWSGKPRPSSPPSTNPIRRRPMPSPKKSKAPVPQPLLKLKFPKFPEKQVAVYFETKTRQFEASFGFDKYSAPSVAALEQKIQKAIKNGATPEPVW